MNEIELDLDLNNELEFKISVEGTKPAQTSCRLVFENKAFDISFPGRLETGGRAVVNVPPLEHILEEGNKKATLEMIVDDRIFKPLTLSVNFKKSIKVFAESIAKEVPHRSRTASAVLLTNKQDPQLSATPVKNSVVKEAADVIKPDWPVDKTANIEDSLKSKLSNLTEDDLRDKIRSLLESKRG